MKRYTCTLLAVFLLAGAMSLVSAYTLTLSQWENAIRFAGTNGYIMVPDTPSLRIQDAVTVMACVKRTRINAIDHILEKGGDWNIGETNYGAGLHTDAWSNMFYFFFDGGWRGTTGVTDTNWHYYAVVAQHGDTNPTFYIDGELRPTELGQGIPTINLNYASTRDLHIGAQLEIAATHYSANIIDEVSIWNRVLDSLQIRSIMMDTIGSAYYATTDSGLVGYWRFDLFEDLGINGGGCDDVRDLSPSSAHGDTVGDMTMVPSGMGVSDRHKNTEILAGFALGQSYPNPFNATTTIHFSLPTRSYVSLKILDLTGRDVVTIVSEELSSGYHSRQWNAAGMPSGVYFYRLQAGSYAETREFILLR